MKRKNNIFDKIANESAAKFNREQNKADRFVQNYARKLELIRKQEEAKLKKANKKYGGWK